MTWNDTCCVLRLSPCTVFPQVPPAALACLTSMPVGRGLALCGHLPLTDGTSGQGAGLCFTLKLPLYKSLKYLIPITLTDPRVCKRGAHLHLSLHSLLLSRGLPPGSASPGIPYWHERFLRTECRQLTTCLHKPVHSLRFRKKCIYKRI